MLFTVIGLYRDNGQRYTDSFEADSPEEAANLACRQAEEDEDTQLDVAAVVTGTFKIWA